jgi:hypothetical protein
MSNQVGDNLLHSIQWGGWQNVEIQVDRSGTPTYETLLPALDGRFRETPVFDRGLDGRVDVKYYERTLVMEYVQTDAETLADLYGSEWDASLHADGAPLKIKFRSGAQKSLTMYGTRELINHGPSGHVSVVMEFKSTSLTPLFRPAE